MFLPYEDGEKREWAVTLWQAVFLVGDLLALARTKLQARHEFGGSPQADVKPLPSPFHPLLCSSPELDMITETEDDVRTLLKPAGLNRSLQEPLQPFSLPHCHSSRSLLKCVAMSKTEMGTGSHAINNS